MGDGRNEQVGHAPIEHAAALSNATSKTKPKEKKDYKGFVAGVFSGIAKLSGELSG